MSKRLDRCVPFKRDADASFYLRRHITYTYLLTPAVGWNNRRRVHGCEWITETERRKTHRWDLQHGSWTSWSSFSLHNSSSSWRDSQAASWNTRWTVCRRSVIDSKLNELWLMYRLMEGQTGNFWANQFMVVAVGATHVAIVASAEAFWKHVAYVQVSASLKFLTRDNILLKRTRIGNGIWLIEWSLVTWLKFKMAPSGGE